MRENQVSAAAKALDALEAAGKTLHNAKDGLAWRIASDELHSLRVNLASPLAAVARAAMARRNAIAALRGGVFNESNYRDLQTAKSRVEYCDAKLDAALDALEAAAKGCV